MGRLTLLPAQPEAARVEGLDDLVNRLLAEVGDRVELALALGYEVPDGLDAGALEAVVGAHPKLELLDEDLVHGVGLSRGTSGAAHARSTEPGLEYRRARLAQLDHAIGVGEDGQLGDEDLGRLAQRSVRIDRAVGLDVESQLVEVGPLADAGLLDVIGHPAYG